MLGQRPRGERASLFASLKKELVHDESYTTRGQGRGSVFEYIEAFYNRPRRHPALGHLSPEGFERTHNRDDH